MVDPRTVKTMLGRLSEFAHSSCILFFVLEVPCLSCSDTRWPVHVFCPLARNLRYQLPIYSGRHLEIQCPLSTSTSFTPSGFMCTVQSPLSIISRHKEHCRSHKELGARTNSQATKRNPTRLRRSTKPSDSDEMGEGRDLGTWDRQEQEKGAHGRISRHPDIRSWHSRRFRVDTEAGIKRDTRNDIACLSVRIRVRYDLLHYNEVRSCRAILSALLNFVQTVQHSVNLTGILWRGIRGGSAVLSQWLETTTKYQAVDLLASSVVGFHFEATSLLGIAMIASALQTLVRGQA
ncbi:hypothetical protein EDB81DRAFT_169486 [Dactylonectria macrodidyma]|uniref:Uncharacterized protein n=1 Tax=Dactylonectria macrodidyma TaxID=307937 RepID=A0A9P9JLH8_9HYPO|nr:hypothetical protein EDB81DRAFT_169486 [Dactylonectria macrodidyma]